MVSTGTITKSSRRILSYNVTSMEYVNKAITNMDHRTSGFRLQSRSLKHGEGVKYQVACGNHCRIHKYVAAMVRKQEFLPLQVYIVDPKALQVFIPVFAQN